MQALFYKILKEQPDSLVARFFSSQSDRDILNVLDFDYGSYHFFRYGKKPIYETFYIPKKSGGSRKIYSPNSGLKEVQRRLNAILQLAIKHKNCTHGFLKDRSILTNAQVHTRQKYVLNFDIADFFPTVHFGRVKGLFKSRPFSFDDDTATFIATLCCFDGKLPQGAPTSPIISNLVCRSLDNDLLALSIRNRCSYTRYADDITISTSQKEFPKEICISNDPVQLGMSLLDVIERNGFAINSSKTRISHWYQSQFVTGIKVNKFPNVDRRKVREVRAMLNNWRKFGIEKVQNDLNSLYRRRSSDHGLDFIKVLRGKLGFIGQVKGFDNKIYLKLLDMAKSIDSTFRIGKEMRKYDRGEIVLFTEGKTDWKHLKKAFSVLKTAEDYDGFRVTFREWSSGDSINNSELLKICETASKLPANKAVIICLFDHDSPEILKKVIQDGSFKYWENNVYSCALPIPDHRTGIKNVCIEHYYTDNDIMTSDSSGKRVFLANEFDKRTRRHKQMPAFNCTSEKIKSDDYAIIDNEVFNERGENIALSKENFAKNILEGSAGFESIDFKYFNLIFSLILNIAATHEEMRQMHI